MTNDCAHPGTIHLGRGFDGHKKCKVCGAILDKYGDEIEE